MLAVSGFDEKYERKKIKALSKKELCELVYNYKFHTAITVKSKSYYPECYEFMNAYLMSITSPRDIKEFIKKYKRVSFFEKDGFIMIELG